MTLASAENAPKKDASVIAAPRKMTAAKVKKIYNFFYNKQNFKRSAKDVRTAHLDAIHASVP